MNMWVVGAGYWGSKLSTTLDKFGISSQIIDIKNSQTIQDISDKSPVILATPLWQHYEQCRTLLEAGHDVYVEKPMAETLDEVQQLAKLVDPGQLFMVGHLFQHHPQSKTIKTMIDQGAIGTVLHITSQRLNWGIYQTKTDPILSLGTHDISIMLDLIGAESLEITQARAYTLSSNLQADRITWSGASGPITVDGDVSWAWPERVRKTTIIGTDGQIVWDQDANTITLSYHKIINNRALQDGEPQVMVYDYDMSPLDYEIQHWIDCVKTRTAPSTGIKQAMAVAHVIDQIKRLI